MVGGSAWHPSDPGGTITHVVYTPLEQSTTDVHKKLKRPDGSLPPSIFEMNIARRNPGTMGRKSNTNWCFAGREYYESYTANHNGYYPERGSASRDTANELYATALLARSHPFAPVYSVPVAIKELAEVASMFEFAAKGFAGFVGGSYLNYRFGWKAFYNDVQTLAGILKHIELRIQEFNYLIEHGSTRKTMQLDHWSLQTGSSNVIMQSSYGVVIKGSITRKYSMKTWGSVTWGLNGDKLLEVDELKRFNQVLRTVFDLGEIDPPTLWELVPFSWLVDYFTNIGDLLHSQQFRYQLQPYDVCIMRHFRNDTTTAPTEVPSTVSAGGGFYLREIKSRDVVYPSFTPTVHADLISHDRWKVILALIARFSGK